MIFFILGLHSGQAATPTAQSTALEVDQVEILGITAIEASIAESALELYPGDKLDRVKVLRTVRNLQELYRARGYEKTRVESELQKRKGAGGAVEVVLVFNVVEGKPTRVSSIKITPTTGVDADPGSQEYWKRISAQVYSRISLGAGDLLDTEKVSATKRVIQDQLVSDEFIGAKVQDVVVSDSKHPAETNSAIIAETSRWVGLEFKIDLGDRVVFSFRGNTVLTRAHLSGLIEELRINGLGRDYVNVILNRIVEEYQSLGFAFVTVKAYNFENPDRRERSVTYEIVEGVRTRIEGISFAGNEYFTQDELLTQFRERSTDRTQFGFYVQKDIQASADALVDWIKSQGFLSAKLVTTQRNFSPKKDLANVMVYLFEGDRTFIKKITVQGFSALTTDEVLSMLDSRDDQPLNLVVFSKGLEALKSYYHSQGYLNFKILNEDSATMVKYSEQNRAAEILVQADEGIRYKVSAIQIEGLTKTKEVVARREVMIQPEDYIEESKLSETEQRLRKLGIFSTVNTKYLDDPSRPECKIIQINIQEGSPGYVAGGPGFRNDLGLRLFAQTGYSNIWGRNHTISLNSTINRRFKAFQAGSQNFVEFQSQLGYVWPWWLSLPEVTFRPRFTVEKTQYVLFSAETVSAATVWDRRLLRKVNLMGSLSYSLERTKQFDAFQKRSAIAKFDNQTMLIGAVTPSMRLDLRDNPLAPTKGFFSTTSFEYAHPGSEGELKSEPGKFPIGYTKFQFRADQFVPVTRSISWYFSFRTGLLRNLIPPPADRPKDPRYAAPLVKQFALGGPGSLRGFSNQELNNYGGIDNNGDPIAIRGTQSYVNYRTQIDVPFSGAMKVGPFLDMANLLVDTYSFGKNLKYGAGLGFHYQTPIGPVNFDWGFNLFPLPNESKNQFVFSVGVI